MADDLRSATNPLFNDNRLKLGVFGANGPGVAFTTVPELFKPTWANSSAVARLADQTGIETIVPYARWKALGKSDHSRSFETSTWASAVSAQTHQSCVMSTTHVQAYHPVVAAKTAASVDQISGGRFAMNIVCGWLAAEIEMFGQPLLPHEERYAAADEWIGLMKRLWTDEGPVTFEGKHYAVRDARIDPRPVQAGGPALMNAGGSERGRHFAAKNADIAFIFIQDPSPDALRANVEAYKRLAREEYGREIQVWVLSYVVQRDSVEDAKRYVDHYVLDHGDVAMADTFIEGTIANAKVAPPEVIEKMRYAIMAGVGGFPLLGTADDITESLRTLSSCGVDGVLLSWIDYIPGLELFSRTVLPRLEQIGLRKSARAAAA
jgi:alkanesulfonate monooxygenase SsuD/methylene tetrahydromethanopterin reductase-like flavin-dependent oxidoreductase (luciferase family)